MSHEPSHRITKILFCPGCGTVIMELQDRHGAFVELSIGSDDADMLLMFSEDRAHTMARDEMIRTFGRREEPS